MKQGSPLCHARIRKFTMARNSSSCVLLFFYGLHLAYALLVYTSVTPCLCLACVKRFEPAESG